MALWALILAIISLALVVVVITILYLFYDLSKKNMVLSNQRINNLPEDIAKKVINDESFQSVLDEAIKKRTKEIIVSSTGRIFNFILLRSISSIKEHINAFKDAKLMDEVDKKVKEVLGSSQEKPAEDPGKDI